MFIEETCEQHILTMFKNAQNRAHASYDTAYDSFKVIEIGDVTVDNINEYVKTAPAIVFCVGEDNSALSTNGARGDSQMLNFSLHVYTFATNKYNKRKAMDSARPILRANRNLLRGYRYVATSAARFLYDRQEKIGTAGPVAVYFQRFEIHALDTNSTERTL